MFRGSSLVLGCVVTISFGVSAFAGALSAVSGVAAGVGNAASSAVGTATGAVAGVAGTATGAVAGVAGTATGAVSGVAGAAGSAVSGATSAVAGAAGDAAGAVGSVAGTAASAVGTAAAAVGTATGAVNGVVGSAANAVGEAVAPSAAAAAALSKSDPQKMDAQWVSKNILKLRGSYLKFRAQQVTVVKRDRPGAGALPVRTELVADSCTRFLDQFQVLQSFSRAALFKNCPEIARQNSARTAGQ